MLSNLPLKCSKINESSFRLKFPNRDVCLFLKYNSVSKIIVLTLSLKDRDGIDMLTVLAKYL